MLFSLKSAMLFLTAMAFDTLGNILLKQGMNGFKSSTIVGMQGYWQNAKRAASNKILLLGALAMVCEAIIWFAFLSITPLNIAAPLSSANNIFILLASSWLLKEHVSRKRWLGVALIMSGMLLVSANTIA
jgi:undecaprenyl phosphate-alpha-L-ara4N flippase subunit ArnE